MTEAVDWRDVLSSSVSLELKALKLRVSDRFFVGGLHQNVKAYDKVLENHSLAEPIGRWIRNGAHVLEFTRPFSGVYEQVKYFSYLPPPKQFPNHAPCRRFSENYSVIVLFLNLLKVIRF